MIEHSGGGGMYAYTDALCTGLYEAGADVTVLTSSKWPGESRPFKVERELIAFTAEQCKSSRLYWAADRAENHTYLHYTIPTSPIQPQRFYELAQTVSSTV